MSKQAKPFERDGEWPQEGGSFIKQADGKLKPETVPEPETDAKPPVTPKGGSAAKDSGK